MNVHKKDDFDVASIVKRTDIITSAGGTFEVPSEQKRKIAITDDGTAYLIENFRKTAEYRSLESKARLRGIWISDFHTVNPRWLDNLYSAAENGDASKTVVEIDQERQIELADIIRTAAQQNASDIVIRVLRGYAEIRMRIFGRMIDFNSYKEEHGLSLINAIFTVASDQNANASMMRTRQGALTGSSGLLPPRVEMIRLQYAPRSEGRGALVMRLKYETSSGDTDIDSLGYSPSQISDISIMRRRTNGMYLLAGKVSSGKSTTLERVLNKIYDEKNREISMFTIEEPVELDIPGSIQIAAQKTPDGEDGFIEGIKAALRMDPNIIVLGEVRSKELAALSVEAVLTGHALWTTIHAGSAIAILDRMFNLLSHGDDGADSLYNPEIVRGLVYQRLVGVMCPSCRKTMSQGISEGAIDTDLATRVSDLVDKPLDHLHVRGEGCSKCRKGLIGRTVVAETILTNAKILEFHKNKDREGLRQHWISNMKGAPVLHHALSKVGAGICDINEVEEEVDLLSVYEQDFMSLKGRLIDDIAALETEAQDA